MWFLRGKQLSIRAVKRAEDRLAFRVVPGWVCALFNGP